MSSTATLISEAEMKQLSVKDRAIYDNKLKSVLEPQFNGQVAAIHLDTGDYEAAKNSPWASRGLRARHPDGLMMVTDIGPAKIDSLTLRMMGRWKLWG